MRSRASLDVRAAALLASLIIGAGTMITMRANDASSLSMATDAQRSTSQPEILMGFRVVGATLHFRVATGGCTTADDFRVDVEQPKDSTGHVALVVHRTRIDACKGFFPDGTEIAFNMDALGISPGQSIVVRNPFSAHGGL